MNFEVLANFDWFNEPDNVRFENNEMVVYAKRGTDFWQSIHHDFKKDNGHFFFCRQDSDFSIVLKWKFDKLEAFSQCGIMLRIDERNWFKASLMNKQENENCLSSVLTIAGHSDWCGFELGKNICDICFRLQRVENDYVLFYSLDGLNFIKFRSFYLKNFEDVKIGAYIANPNQENFNATLAELDIG